ncbi:NAD-dependent epimerase/dehydratase family protein [Streptomyces boncukensis]|uniref:NAD-dependent epimerase/dehydratase family protein n=1 Tax=Streptomyces boncukensis TaxID=2711219 RepID=A0A6G4WXD6_9ACTN|nr:NAD-dependent epimerase/dehydratase family protein [Streptomyces boncukensis]NGO69184.1 NAD-dependent epimerase/dehydratase family protein [Streptomyces boncukensis]
MADGSRAFVLGATGQIGMATVDALLADGWEVTAASRSGGRDDARQAAGVRSVALDRDEEGALAAAVGDGHGLLVDVTAMTPAHTRQLTALADRVDSAVVISSAAVYEDDEGRGFSAQDGPRGFPHYPVPLRETQRTAAPGDDSYDARKALLEQELLALGDRMPTTLLRAGTVHGPYCRAPRELYWVKRWLDGRRVRILAFGGRSRFHPAHVDNIAELVRLAARRPGSRVLNAADPEAPSDAAIAEALGEVLGWEAETVLLEDGAPEAEQGLGMTPWSIPYPVVLDMAAAERELGYRAVTTYEESLPRTVEWITGQLRDRDWREAFPALAWFFGDRDPFDYAAEDRWLAARSG